MQTKSKKGYAIMSKKGDRMEFFDARLPIYWLRGVADDAMRDHGYDGKIVRVIVQMDK